MQEERQRQYQANTFEKPLAYIVNELHFIRCKPTGFEEEITGEQPGKYENEKAALPELSQILSSHGAHPLSSLFLRIGATVFLKCSIRTGHCLHDYRGILTL